MPLLLLEVGVVWRYPLLVLLRLLLLYHVGLVVLGRVLLVLRGILDGLDVLGRDVLVLLETGGEGLLLLWHLMRHLRGRCWRRDVSWGLLGLLHLWVLLVDGCLWRLLMEGFVDCCYFR